MSTTASHPDPTTNPLADPLGSLYIDGNATSDSYDVGLKISSTNPLGVLVINRPSSPHERNHLRKEEAVRLTRPLEKVETALKQHFMDRLRSRKATLQRVQLILEVETYDRILEAYNDLIFQQLRCDEIETLRKLGIHYIRQLLNPPINLKEDELECVEYALGKLSDEQYHAANALLPILDHLKSSPLRSHTIQYYLPTIEEGACYIKELPLGLDDKMTLFASLTDGSESWRGEKLFLPSNTGETQVETLEREIQELEVEIAKLM